MHKIENRGFCGELYLPQPQGAGLAVVLIMSSSAGLSDIRERFYARFFAQCGLAALVVDSFAPRGIVETMRDQSLISEQEMEADAYAAFDYLAGDERFDGGRIAIMGVSKGGLVALNTALLARRAWFGRRGRDFAASIALVPPAHMQQRDARLDGRSVLVQLAGRDDYTGLAPALAYAARLRESGARLASLVYPKAHHAWELTGPPQWLAEVENYSHCRLFVEDNAELADLAGGGRLTLAEFFANRERYCVLGAHAGGGTNLFKRQAALAIVRFLEKNGIWNRGGRSHE